MDGSTGGLRLFDAAPAAEGPAPDEADCWFAREAMRPPPRGPRPEPYTPAWFARLEHARHGRHGDWMPRALEFAKHPDETVLGLGDGLGTDWAAYARHGARVIAAARTPEQLDLVKRNFAGRGLPGQFVLAPADRLPLPPASVDVVNFNGLWSGPGDLPGLAAELFRVLRPGGKVLALVPAKYDVAYWASAFFPWRRWPRGRGVTFPPGYTARRLVRHFDRFSDHRVHKRHLRRAELPYLWRLVPVSLLERLIGRVLVLKAFKPLSAAIGLPAAA